jgi:amino acid transporter
MENGPSLSSENPPQSTVPREAEDEQKHKMSWREFLFGKPRDPHDRRLFHSLSLVPVLAWIGLGADGLSSSSYGPEAAFHALVKGGHHTYLAIPLALLMALTVWVISACYMRIIEVFPFGGGGYLVATKLLGERWGIVAGSALLVDYILTITTSVAAAGDALFSLAPDYSYLKVPSEVLIIVFLSVINIRGVRESILLLLPIFMTFLVTHIALIISGVVVHAGDLGVRVHDLRADFKGGYSTLGFVGMMALFFQAYSLGGGTYTGIEAVSNGLGVMREPRVQNGKRTMLYMAFSLSFTAAGLILCYLLAKINPAPDPNQTLTMNALLTQDILGKCFPADPGTRTILLLLTLVSEGALLVVAAQAGFIGGPRVMANMAIDSLLPHRFQSLSDRFTTSNGIVLMAVTSLAALLYAGGNVGTLVLMYSINVFVTFSLAQLGMLRYWFRNRGKEAVWKKRLFLFLTGFFFCSVILVITIVSKFLKGGWVTLAITGSLVLICMAVKGYYRRVGKKIRELQADLEMVREENVTVPPFNPSLPTAAIMVNAYGGLGMHTILKILQVFPGYFKNFHFVSVGTIDLGNFKGTEEIEALERTTEENMKKYVQLAQGLGFPATYSFNIGTDTVDGLEELCKSVAKAYHTVVFFSGKIIFEREKWYHVLFHNMTAYNVQKRLQWAGLMMVILPVRLFDRPVR